MIGLVFFYSHMIILVKIAKNMFFGRFPLFRNTKSLPTNIQAASFSVHFKNQSIDKPVNNQLPSSQTSRLLSSHSISRTNQQKTSKQSTTEQPNNGCLKLVGDTKKFFFEVIICQIQIFSLIRH